MFRGVRTLQKEHKGTDFLLLSNSNEVYIGTILPVRLPRAYSTDSTEQRPN